MKRLDHYWQDRNPLALALLPLAALFCLVAELRAAAYRTGMLVSRTLPVPVVVVGNITVGGTGKTPLVIWLARHLKSKGYRPGVLTRGYLGNADDWPQLVKADGDPEQVGDEAVLLARHCDCPVAAGPDRVESGHMLLEQSDCDLLICDDGMQHYGLNRDLEIALLDGERRLGNGFCLPAGPLRERPARLKKVDLTLINGRPAPGELRMTLQADRAVRLNDPLTVRPLADFVSKKVAAIAGIGNPERFFDMLRGRGLRVQAVAFQDHYSYTPADLTQFKGLPILMTEKDAVKCEAFAADNYWYVPVETVPDPDFVKRLDHLLKGLNNNG